VPPPKIVMTGLCPISAVAGGFARLHRLLFKLFPGRSGTIDDPLPILVGPSGWSDADHSPDLPGRTISDSRLFRLHSRGVLP
jgi:hypothetical protein